MHNLYFGKSVAQNYERFVTFQKLPNANNRPLGENSSNLVTLIWRHHFFPTGFGHFHLGS
jgi:hypothetical protein